MERKGSATVLKKAADPSYGNALFSIKDNYYGAKLNTSQL